MKTNNVRVQQAHNITFLGLWINIGLSIAKVSAGIFGKSSAMVADGVHSLSDMITDIIVIVLVKASARERDRNHHYGHGKFETFATMLISFALFLVAAGIFFAGIKKVLRAINGEIIEQPGMVALIAALISIFTKELLFWMTIKTGKKINSPAVIANAWHHRSDAFSSIGTALGITGAMFLGVQWRILDPIAGVIVSFFIAKVAWDLAKPSIKELLENALPDQVEKDISAIILSIPGVKGQHNLRTRKIGYSLAIEVHVKVDRLLTVELSHNIATAVENALRDKFGSDTHVGVHIEPYS